MKYELEKRLLFERLRPHLKRWQDQLSRPSQPNKELAERSIRRLYKLYGKPSPRIVWCNDPYQMAVIPPMISFILQTTEWEALKLHMQKFSEESWQDEFERSWRKFNKLLLRFSKQMSNGIFNVDTELRQSFREKLKTLIRELLHDRISDSRPDSTLKPAEQLSQSWGYRHNVSDADFIKRRMALEMKVLRKARLGHAMPLRTLVSAMNMTFAPELLLHLLPASKELVAESKLSELQYKLAADLKQAFRDYENRAMTVSNWYASLPLSGRSRSFACTWLPADASFLPFALSCSLIKEGFLGEIEEETETWAHLSYAAAGYYFCKDFCFVCPAPATLLVDDAFRPHNQQGAAARWTNGYETFAWKGQSIDPGLIRSQSLITVKKIRSCHNIERRRLMIDIYGEDRFIHDAGAAAVAEDRFGTLYKITLPRDETLAILKVKNSSAEADGSYRTYYLRVPPDMASPRQAVAWTFGLKEHEYMPDIES